jgi:hypothetical protein
MKISVSAADHPSPTPGKRRVTLTPGQIEEIRAMSDREAGEKYGCSRITLWRIRSGRQDWYCPDYHKAEETIDAGVAGLEAEEIIRCAKVGTRMALRELMDGTAYGRIETFLAPLTLEDVESDAIYRLLRLTGHPDFTAPRWRIAVARNAARASIIRNVARARRSEGPAPLDAL